MAFAALPLTAYAEEPLDEYSVTANDRIGLNLYIDLNPAVRNTEKVTITYTNEALETVSNTYNVADLTPYHSEGNHTQYAFTVITAPALIGNPVTVSFDEGIAPLETSIVNYTSTILPTTDDDYLRYFCDWLEIYGLSAHYFFNKGEAFIPFGYESYEAEETYFFEHNGLFTRPFEVYYGLSRSDIVERHYIPYESRIGYGHSNDFSSPIETTGFSVDRVIYMAKAIPELRFYYTDIDEAQAAEYNEQGIAVTGVDGITARFMKDENENVFLEVTGILAENAFDEITVSFGNNENSVKFATYGAFTQHIYKVYLDSFGSYEENLRFKGFTEYVWGYFNAANAYFNYGNN